MNTHRQYPTDLTQAQWQLLLLLLPKGKWRQGGPGRPASDLRKIINGILYLTRSGCQWRMLPKTFGCWQTVYGYFNRWRKQKIWQRIYRCLLNQERARQGRKKDASAGCLDSQSIKSATHGKSKGFDAGKKVNGRKRHLLVDTLGLPITVFVSPADCTDQKGAVRLLNRYFKSGRTRLRKLWVDGGYRGDGLRSWVQGLKGSYKIDLETVTQDASAKGFQVVKRRWVVERTFAWLLNFRRHSKDYERLTKSSEAFIYIAMSYLLIKRLAQKSEF